MVFNKMDAWCYFLAREKSELIKQKYPVRSKINPKSSSRFLFKVFEKEKRREDTLRANFYLNTAIHNYITTFDVNKIVLLLSRLNFSLILRKS